MPTFLDEFTDLLSTIRQGSNERLIICGDFNLPGDEAASMIDERLASLPDVQGYMQHVTEPTRSSTTGGNLLDLLITSKTTSLSLISNVDVHAQHTPSV